MTESVPPVRIATVAGRPVTDCLPAASAISGTIMRRFVLDSSLPERLPVAVLRRDVTAMVSAGLELLARLLRGEDAAAPPAAVRASAMEWAHAGVPVDVIHRVVRESVQSVLDHVAAHADSDADRRAVAVVVPAFVDLAARLALTISQAYLSEVWVAAGDAGDTVAEALVGGVATRSLTRAAGVRPATTYLVLAVELAPHHEEGDPRLDRRITAHRKVRRVRAEVLRLCGDRALTRMTADGGIVLIPRERFDPAGAGPLVDRLAVAAQTRIRATCVLADVAGIPEAAERATAVLDIMRRLRLVGFHRFEDLSLEYQLTRPGAARRQLAALLDPLDRHPVLLDTLIAHLATRATRLSTARVLHVHPNTIDYRLNRIAEITGLDPLRPDGIWRIRSALVARLIGLDEDAAGDRDALDDVAPAC